MEGAAYTARKIFDNGAVYSIGPLGLSIWIFFILEISQIIKYAIVSNKVLFNHCKEEAYLLSRPMSCFNALYSTDMTWLVGAICSRAKYRLSGSVGGR